MEVVYNGNTCIMGTTAIAVKIEQETKDRMKRLAELKQRSTHWLMKEAILQYVEREEKSESFRQEALLARNEYQTTGLHVTSEEADAWLAKLEEGQDLEPPECHVCLDTVCLARCSAVVSFPCRKK